MFPCTPVPHSKDRCYFGHTIPFLGVFLSWEPHVVTFDGRDELQPFHLGARSVFVSEVMSFP